MREAYAHECVVELQDGDERALGAAITAALCGHWDPEPPCPLSPHHTGTTQDGPVIQARTLFAAEPANQSEVRSLIEAALQEGELTRPDGVSTHWRLLSAQPRPVTGAEAEHAQRLINS